MALRNVSGNVRPLQLHRVHAPFGARGQQTWKLVDLPQDRGDCSHCTASSSDHDLNARDRDEDAKSVWLHQRQPY